MSRLGRAALFALPLLVLVASVAHPSHRLWNTAVAVAAGQRERWYLSHLLVLVGMALLVLVVAELQRALPGPRDRLEQAGAGLTLVGAVGVGGLGAIELVVWEMSHPSLSAAEMAELGDRMAHSLLFVVPLLAGLAPFTLGLCLLALTLERSGVGPRRAALVGGVALALAIAAFPLPAVAIPAAVLALVGLGSVGWALPPAGAARPNLARAGLPR